MKLKSSVIKSALLNSLIWGILLPILFPIIIKIGPNRLVTTQPDGNVITNISNMSGYMSLVEYYGINGVFHLWIKSFILVGSLVFIICISFEFINWIIRREKRD